MAFRRVGVVTCRVVVMAPARSAGPFPLPVMNVIRFKSIPILRQLLLEERMLRTSSDNWCIINDGTDTPTIVMGMSGKSSELVELEPVLKDKIPVIKRFSGGGTVIVDDKTIFVTFICNRGAIPGLQLYPRDIMSWSGQLYSTVFRGINSFHLRENDYVFADRKFGGNAQSITKNRWLHHTSFLWDYEVRNMEYLQVPAKTPTYRLARSHADFICSMKEYLPLRSDFIERLITSLGTHFSLKHVHTDTDAGLADSSSYTGTTRLLTEEELKVDLSEKQDGQAVEAFGSARLVR